MLSLIFLSVFPAALLIAAANDVYEFKIPNWVSILLATSFFCGALAMRAPADAVIESALIGACALLFGFILFARGVVGGGDAKLFASTVLWVGMPALPHFFVSMAISGAYLAVFLIIFRKLPALPVYAHAPFVMRLHQAHKDIPYAVAICAGGLLSFQETLLFQLGFGG